MRVEISEMEYCYVVLSWYDWLSCCSQFYILISVIAILSDHNNGATMHEGSFSLCCVPVTNFVSASDLMLQ